MLSGLFIAILMLLGTMAFNVSFAVSGTQSAYLGLYKGIVERNVLVVRDGDRYGEIPYFDLVGLQGDLEIYFHDNLRNCCRSYSFSLTGKERHYAGYIDAVRIDLSVQLTMTWAKDYVAIFTIERNS